MKIMYVANGNGLSDKIGGSLTRTINIAKRLQKKGHKIYFLTTIGGFRACMREKLYAQYYILPASILRREERSLLDRLLSYIIALIAFALILNKMPKVDVICTDSDYFCDTLPAVLYKIRFKGGKWVAMTHHKISVADCNKYGGFVTTFFSLISQELSYSFFKKYANEILVLRSGEGKMIARYLISKGISQARIEYVSNGVDLEFAKSVQTKEKIYDACFLGGLRPSKGLYDIIPIWKEVCMVRKDAVLLIIGNIASVYLKRLKNQVSKSELSENVKIVGFVTNEKKIEYLKSSKVLLSPSYEEGWGIAQCEALACGLPVVAYDLPAYGMFRDSLIKVPLGQKKAFADALLSLLMDERLRLRMGEIAKYEVSRFDWDKIAETECEILSNQLCT